jgi:lariat debranching enzyme
VIIGGDFQVRSSLCSPLVCTLTSSQAARNSNDIACMSVPQKYKVIGDFHEYYSGRRTAPYLTIFVGGNHEASNHMFELYYGGWVAPNIYYLGAANVIRYGPLRIAGMSGIWKGYDYRKPHHERLPYNSDDLQSIYHVRELDVRKLLQIRTQVDVGLSHDWPKQIERAGDYESLFNAKKGFREDSAYGTLGSTAAKHVFDRLRPPYWFSSHLHVKFAAAVKHGEYDALVPQKKDDNAAQSHMSRPPQAPHSFGLDGTVLTSLVPEDENQENGHLAAERTTAEPSDPILTAPNNLSDGKAPEASAHESQKDTATPEATDVAAPDAPDPNVAGGSAFRWPGPNISNLGDTESRLSAWNNFHTEATQRERAENARLMEERSKPGPLPEAQHNLTWKRVNIDEDGLNRTIMRTERPEGAEKPENRKQEAQQTAGNVKNEDEIDLDLDSSSDRGSPAEEAARTGNMSKDAASDVPATGTKRGSDKEDARQVSKRSHPNPPAGVSDTLRSQLPASFARPEPAAKPVHEPLPEAISNTITNFLALDKCSPRDEFLQLVELQPVSEHDDAAFERPYRLQYDKEWLAITRVFANDLQLGDPNVKPPADKGHAIYRPQIEQEEQWVEENVVTPGKLAVPENFSPTAPFYDPAVPVTTKEQPPEYTNPQTAQFCELIGIDNKFHLSDEERQARMDAGPRPDRDRDGSHRRFAGRGRGRGGGRGRGRGRNPPRY